jgi:D-tagatose-1,6-bisphosphate aldolase subunit GatZ/KbaZ
MNTLEFFRNLIEASNRGEARGIYSICSAHERVILAAMAQARADDLPLLIESTANQVNQFGGYTGMSPPAFRESVLGLAARVGFPDALLIFGGDHLGPYPWRGEAADPAMRKACELVAACVQAGYTKIHLDASMPLGGDDVDGAGGLPAEVAARRQARLAAAAEAAFAGSGRAAARGLTGGRAGAAAGAPPVYVIGTDVPPPGGARGQDAAVPVTTVEEFERTVAVCEAEFSAAGLEDAWGRVIAVVVQPGVEFGDHLVYEYDPARAAQLIAAARAHSGLVLEGHSTDYQRAELLRRLVEDGVAILKVGPALTFAMRECLFALESIEKELLGGSYKARLSELGLFLDKAMADNPQHWRGYYSGNAQELYVARKYSLLDRSRYYWRTPMVQEAVQRLAQNLRQTKIPLTLISQYLPRHYLSVRRGRLSPDPEALIEAGIRLVLEDYSMAVTPGGS